MIMVNAIRGETALQAGTQTFCLLLTLGALAEIEDALGLDDLSQISNRLKSPRAADLAIVAAALLRGGGHALSPVDVLKLACPLGHIIDAVAECFERAGLHANFSDAQIAEQTPSPPYPGSAG